MTAGPAAHDVALAIDSVHKSFGTVEVLRGVSLAVPQGDIAVVLGPSGEGKTTLLRLIAGFDRPDRGTIIVDGRVVASPAELVPPERRRVGIVPQEGALFPHLTVEANVAFGLRRHDRNRAARVAEVLAMVGLDGMQRRRPRQLSGGQQHRVALARALAPSPHLVLLDEPFSSLDTGLRAQVRNEVVGALRAAGTTAVVVTHDQVEAMAMADHLAVMLGGVVAQWGPPDELYRQPATAAVGAFLGDSNLLAAGVRDGYATCVLGDVPLAGAAGGTAQRVAGQATVLLRPEQLCLTTSDRGTTVTVTAREYYGHDAMVELRCTDHTRLIARVGAHEVPAVGDVVHVAVRGMAWPVPAPN